MKIRIASTLLALALPLVAQEPASSQVEATFYKAFYLEKGPRRFEEASALYTKFLAAAPEHKLAKEAAKQQYRLLDRLGKSKERDAFKAKYGDLIGKIASGGTRPQRGTDAGGRPGRGEGNDRGGRGERGERGGRGGDRGERGGRGGRRGRGGIFGLLRSESKISEMSKEQLEELKTGLEGAPQMIERMSRMLDEETSAKLLKTTEAMKKALDAGKTEEAQKALDGMRKSMEGVMGRRGGRGGRGGEEGGRGGRGGQEGGRGGRGGRGGNREGGGGGGNSGGGGGGGGN